MDDSRIKDAASLLSGFFDEEKLRRGSRYAELFRLWDSLVGERLAAHSKIVDVDKGILIVEAEHPGWIQLLQLRQAELLGAVAARYPELGLRGVLFRLGRMRELGPGLGGAAKSRPGPFGPEGGALAPEAPPLAVTVPDAGPEDADRQGASERPAPKLEDIADPEFRALLGRLKTKIEGGDPDAEAGADPATDR